MIKLEGFAYETPAVFSINGERLFFNPKAIRSCVVTYVNKIKSTLINYKWRLTTYLCLNYSYITQDRKTGYRKS